MGAELPSFQEVDGDNGTYHANYNPPQEDEA